MGRTASALRASCSGAKIVDGGILNNVSDTELKKFAGKVPLTRPKSDKSTRNAMEK